MCRIGGWNAKIGRSGQEATIKVVAIHNQSPDWKRVTIIIVTGLITADGHLTPWLTRPRAPWEKDI